jgi:hypothetical protein
MKLKLLWKKTIVSTTENDDDTSIPYSGCLKSGTLDRMEVGFTTTCALSAYHHWCSEFESRSGRGVQHYVIKFVSDLQQVGGFLWVSGFLHQ